MMKQERDLVGKTIVVTGATSGIGCSIARTLALRGAHVIGLGRSQVRCVKTVNDILEKGEVSVNLSFVVADLAIQRQVRQAADEISALVEAAGARKIDALVNNVASVSSWYSATEDGYELQFAVNHLAPFLLTHQLMPLLLAAPAARVITVSSTSHYRTRVHWSDIMYRRHYSCLMAYKQSKLANVLFTIEFNRRLGQHSSVRAYAADPGLVNTEIGLKGTGGLEQWVWQSRRRGGVSSEQGAATAIYLASEPVLTHRDAVYWKDCRPSMPSRVAQNRSEASRLWALSEQLCGITWGGFYRVGRLSTQAQEQPS